MPGDQKPSLKGCFACPVVQKPLITPLDLRVADSPAAAEAIAYAVDTRSLVVVAARHIQAACSLEELAGIAGTQNDVRHSITYHRCLLAYPRSHGLEAAVA